MYNNGVRGEWNHPIGGHPLFTDVDVSSSLNMIHEEGTKNVPFSFEMFTYAIAAYINSIASQYHSMIKLHAV